MEEPKQVSSVPSMQGSLFSHILFYDSESWKEFKLCAYLGYSDYLYSMRFGSNGHYYIWVWQCV